VNIQNSVLVRAALALVVLSAICLVGGFVATNVVVVDISILASVLAAGLMIAARRLTAGSAGAPAGRGRKG